MKLLTKAQHTKLIANYHLANSIHDGGCEDLPPVVKLFGGTSCTWLLVDLDPETNIAFALCDLGFGTPELGSVSLDELKAIKFPPFGLPVERDRHFETTMPISKFASTARNLGYIET
jgi:hypothetical protein|tara:strand:+ start:729 stop:1079 length:351 start_codon:yes stop_codon:yes gene_type:complete